MDFDYKKYSLENLEKWMSDALSSSEATPQEIYDVIKGVVDEDYHYFKHRTGRCYELLALLNGNGHPSLDKDESSEEYKKSKEPSAEDLMPPWGHSDMEALKYTEEELNVMCDKAASDQEKEKCHEYNLREAEYYDKRAQLDLGRNRTYDEMVADGYLMTDDGFWMPPGTKDKVKKWVLPVEETKIAETDETEYFVSFPDDLLEAADLKEGDQVEWVDKGDGSYLLRKVTKPSVMEKF